MRDARAVVKIFHAPTEISSLDLARAIGRGARVSRLRARGTPRPVPPSPQVPDAAAVQRTFASFLRRTHLSSPSAVARIVAEEAATLGGEHVQVCLVDHEQEVLVAVPEDEGAEAVEHSIDGTLAGRSFAATTIVLGQPDADGRRRLWLPLLDGTERLGVVGVTVPAAWLDEELIASWERFAHLVAVTIVAKRAYGDVFERVRRRAPMTIASELLWSLAPPLVFATDDLALAGLLEPAYDNGGDALDYAVNGRTLHAGVFDAMGHGLPAAGVAAFAISAYRHSRRAGLDLEATYAAMDAAVGEQYPDRRFVTAVIAELDLDTGHLRWICAGHPPPVIIRDRHPVLPATTPVPPLGTRLQHRPPTVATAALEPGDLVLLHTDGLTEAQNPAGERFSPEHVVRFIIREAAAGRTAPETLRRMRHALLHREQAELRDDATALLLEWRSGGELRILPPTVAG